MQNNNVRKFSDFIPEEKRTSAEKNEQIAQSGQTTFRTGPQH